MSGVIDLVRDHYEANMKTGAALADKVAVVLGGMAGPVSTVDTAGIDQFHVGGLAATVELGKRLGLKPGMAVLDAGSGLGGPSRVLAETYGCTVTGVDLAPSFVAVSRLLASRAGLNDCVRYDVGDLTALSFEDAVFDAAYSQHVVMNIADRAAVCRELRRVLKPGAHFAFYDVLSADDKQDPHYPVPWAADASTSFLLTEAETRAALEDAGFAELSWSDVTTVARDWAVQQQTSPANQTANLGMIMGPRMSDMAGNMMRNLGEGRLKLIMSVWTAT